MASSLFGSQPASQQPQMGHNPVQAVMQATQALRNSSPEQLMQSMMRSNQQFAAFVSQNKGKSPEQIAKENGIDLGAVMRAFK